MIELPDRFWKKVDKRGPFPFARPELGRCWIWTASVLVNSKYGQFRWRGTTRRAHVVSYESINGPVPNGLELDHLCRVRRCVNPAHLEPVTRKKNASRGNCGRTMTVCCECGGLGIVPKKKA